MKVKKSEKIVIKISVDEALKIQDEFGLLKGVKDDMTIVEFIERLDMVT